MKKILLLSLCAISLFSTAKLKAQTFTVPHDTVHVPAFSTTSAPHDDITNITGSNITIRWQVIASDFPNDWLTSLAFGICDAALCRNNGSYVLWNPTTSMGTSYNCLYGGNSTHDSMGVFDLVLDFGSATSTGTHYVTIALTDIGASYTKNITFIVTKVPVSVPAAVNSSVSDVVLYPNPARDELNVIYDANADIKNISVYNIIGKMMAVYKVAGPSANLNLENVPAGIYFVQLVNSKGNVVVTKKFTKQ